jgi:hypothetical protein
MLSHYRTMSAGASFAHAKTQDAYSTALLFLFATPPAVLLLLMRPPLMLPLASVLLLACAAAAAVAAWLTSAERNTLYINLWDLAGAYAFIGFAAGMLSNPQEVSEIWNSPALPEALQ